MNKVILSGNLTADPEVKYTTGENSRAFVRFSVACQRKYKNQEGNYECDFPSCTAYGKTAEFVGKYFHKGDRIEVAGEIKTGSYVNKEGNKVYTTDVNVSEVGFGGSGKSSGGSGNSGNSSPKADDSFMNIPDIMDNELPFDV